MSTVKEPTGERHEARRGAQGVNPRQDSSSDSITTPMWQLGKLPAFNDEETKKRTVQTVNEQQNHLLREWVSAWAARRVAVFTLSVVLLVGAAAFYSPWFLLLAIAPLWLQRYLVKESFHYYRKVPLDGSWIVRVWAWDASDCLAANNCPADVVNSIEHGAGWLRLRWSVHEGLNLETFDGKRFLSAGWESIRSARKVRNWLNRRDLVKLEINGNPLLLETLSAEGLLGQGRQCRPSHAPWSRNETSRGLEDSW